MNVRPIVLIALALTACTPKRIPGTDLFDTVDNRAILDVIERYRIGVQRQDVPAVVSLLSRDFFDDGGSADPSDDMNYQNSPKVIGDRYKKLADVRLDITVRKLDVKPNNAEALVTYTYQLVFTMPSYSSKVQSEGDQKQMHLKKDSEGKWKIVSGI